MVSPYNVNLNDEEKRGGHTLRDHVMVDDKHLMNEVSRDKYIRNLFGGLVSVEVARESDGRYLSRESANDFVNRTLENNKDQVEAVRTGLSSQQVITERFGRQTGREAYRPSVDAEPYLRDTYSAKVIIRSDTRAERGYTVSTSFPINQRPRLER